MLTAFSVKIFRQVSVSGTFNANFQNDVQVRAIFCPSESRFKW